MQNCKTPRQPLRISNVELYEAKEEIYHSDESLSLYDNSAVGLGVGVNCNCTFFCHVFSVLKKLFIKKMKNKDRMITDLNEMRQFEHELRQKSESHDELEKLKELIEDIQHLKVVNDEKELEIENISNQNENLKAQLDVLHNAKKEEPNCLDDELGPNFIRKFACKECWFSPFKKTCEKSSQ
jgi:hypothetical protein